MLHIHQGNRMEVLAGRLASLLRTAPAGPLEVETVVVPGRGLERWLRLRLASELGICAHLEFPLPAVFAWRLLRAALPREQLPAEPPPPPAWRLLTAFGDDAEPGLEGPWRDLPAGGEARAELALQLAEVFGQYLVYRPDWLLEWEQGMSVGEVSPEVRRQAALWRRVAAAGGGLHWARQTRALLERAADGTLGRPAWPRRVSLFGLPSVSPRYLELLKVLAQCTEIHLFVLNPCREYWGDIVAPAARERAAVPYMEEGNRLLAVLGRQGRDFQELLLEHCSGAEEWEELFVAPRGTGLLGRLQGDLLQLQEPLPPAPESSATGDRSLEVHVCHGPLREVEVLHDRLLTLFEETPDLAPRQVAVTAPDFSAYADCIDAVFGAAPQARCIPYTLAGGPESEPEKLLRLLLRLPRVRLDSHYLLDLLEIPAVQARFGLDEEALGRIRRWLSEAGIGWGLDERDWCERNLPPARAHTWRAGLDRLLLGYALPLEEEYFAGLVPVPAVAREGLTTLDGLCELLDTLGKHRERLRTPQSPARWAELLHEMLGRYLDPGAGQERALTRLRAAVQRFKQDARAAGCEQDLELEAMAALLRASLSEHATLPTADGVVCAPMPVLRGIPFEVLCVLGLNDGSLPRPRRRPSFDLLRNAKRRRRGDRSPRDEDRGLFLDILLSARRCLHLSYTGRRARDDLPLPPARPLQELLDYLERSGDAAAERLCVQHPPQPFSRRCFDAAAPRLHSYAEEFRPVGQQQDSVFFPTPLEEPGSAAVGTEPIEFGDLIDFFKAPARHLLRGSLALALPHQEEEVPATEPLRLTGLRRYQLRTRLLEALLAGREPPALQRLLAATGLLPPGAMGAALLRTELAAARRLAAAVSEVPPAEHAVLEQDLELGGRVLRCRLEHLARQGVFHYRPGRLRPVDELILWLEHLVWHLAVGPGNALLLGLEPQGGTLCRRLRPLDVESARRELSRLLELYELGRRRPLPCSPVSARARATGRSATTTEQRRETEEWFFRTAFRGRAWEQDPEFERCARIVWEPLRECLEED